MKENENTWVLRRLYPFDFNKDGKFTLSDIVAMLFMPPKKVFDLLF